MRSVDPKSLPIPQRHQYLISAIGPRPIAWVSTISQQGNHNLAPFSFFNVFSSNPPILVFSSNRRGRDNTTKDTLHNVLATKEAVINIVSYPLVNQMNITSTDYPPEVSEFEKAGVTPIPSLLVKPPRVQEALVQFECQVQDIIALGTEGGAGNLIICEVVQMHFSESILDEEGQIDPNKLQLVARMGEDYYTKAFGESLFEIDNPFQKDNLGFDQLPDYILNSQFLTGNEIAQFAMESTFPTEEEMNEISNSFLQKSPAEKHQMAKRLLEQGNVRGAFALLMKVEREED